MPAPIIITPGDGPVANRRAYEKYVQNFRYRVLHDPELKDDIEAVNKELRQKTLTPGAVSRTQLLENLAIAYANEEFIGTRLMPIVPVQPSEGLSVEYWTYDQDNQFSYPDDAVGTNSNVNTVSEGVTIASTSLQRRALKEFSDAWVVSMQDNVVSRLIDPQMNVLHGLNFKIEQRIATILCSSANYGSNTIALTGSGRWDVATGDPAAVVDKAKLSLWSGFGPGRWVAFTSPGVHNVLKRNPAVLDTFKYTGNPPKMATKQMLAEYFEVDEYIVGAARYNSSNEGQTASYSRIWSDVFGIIRVADNPSVRSASFGLTLQQPIETQTWFIQGQGGRGGYWVQSSHADKSLVTSSACGYLITTPIS